MKLHVMGFESSRKHESERRVMICCPVTFFVPALIEPVFGRPVILYTSVLYERYWRVLA